MNMLAQVNRFVRNIIGRLVAYYTVMIVAFMGLFRAFPEIPVYVNAERLRGEGASLNLDPSEMISTAGQNLRTGDTAFLDPYTSVPVLLALFSVMVLTIPVAWVYRWTRRPSEYDSSIAHALLVLPIAITLVVFLVKGSLALAFSLAGIVAAVRFRTALSGSEDAVFMFVVIGIGLAAGVQLTNVAFIASIFFNIVALYTWWHSFGETPALLSGFTIIEEPPPKVDPALFTVNDDASKARYNTLLRLPTTDVESTQRSVLPLLDASSKGWRFVRVVSEDTSDVVEFEARLKKSVDYARFARDLENSAPETGRVEITRIKRPVEG
ncbi:MAG: DUF4956 domain-containing protein [Myxococcota bacterium]